MDLCPKCNSKKITKKQLQFCYECGYNFSRVHEVNSYGYPKLIEGMAMQGKVHLVNKSCASLDIYDGIMGWLNGDAFLEPVEQSVLSHTQDLNYLLKAGDQVKVKISKISEDGTILLAMQKKDSIQSAIPQQNKKAIEANFNHITKDDILDTAEAIIDYSSVRGALKRVIKKLRD